MSDISLTVLNDMRLMITPEEVARDSEHNSAVFRVVAQPSSLDALACRAEVMTAGGTTYRLVENGEFSLTNDIAVRGLGRIQLVYSDGTDVIRKTSVAGFHVTGSLNAVDESAPGFGDGLAQLQGRCFADADLVGMTLNFYNLSGQLVGTVTSPAGGIEEVPAAQGAYARFRGPTGTSWVDFTTLGVASTSSPIFTGNPTAPTPPPGDSSQRLATTDYVWRDFLPRVGGQMQGPLIATAGGSLTNMGLAFGDNATGFYRTGNVLVVGISGGFVTQYTPTAVMMNVNVVMGNMLVTNMGDATSDTDALNRRSGDARYLQQAAADLRYLSQGGGTVAGVLSFTPGQGIVFQPGSSVLYENNGVLVLRQAANDLGVFIEPSNGVTAGRRRILTTDDGRAASLVVELPASQTFTSGTFVNVFPITYPIPRGGNSRIMVSVLMDCALPGDGQIAIAALACSNAPATIRRTFVYQLNAQCSGIAAQFVFDVAGTSIGPFDVMAANLGGGAGGSAPSWTALAGAQAVVTDLGPR
jgi:hypothetical protein